MNYDSARFNELHADSAKITNLAIDHINADSGRLGAITSGVIESTLNPYVIIGGADGSDDTTTKWAFQGAPSTGRADIEFATTRPVQYFILRDNSGGGVNNSMFLWNNHADSNAGWVGFSGDRSFRIHSTKTI